MKSDIKLPAMLLIATTNEGKYKEISALLAPLDIRLVNLRDVRFSAQVIENGNSYVENAVKKARTFANISGILTLADDTGLEVDALGGAPGLYSSRFVKGGNATDAQRRAYLLEKLSGFPRPWTACFRCSVAIAVPESEVFVTEGICPGEIIPEERGGYGFGYDPIFLVSSLGKTLAEIPLETKNRISHRALAIRKAQTILLDLLNSGN